MASFLFIYYRCNIRQSNMNGYCVVYTDIVIPYYTRSTLIKLFNPCGIRIYDGEEGRRTKDKIKFYYQNCITSLL